MNKAHRTCVFYSKGRNFVDVLRHVKQYAPTSRIVAMVPSGYPVSSAEREIADEVIELRAVAYFMRRPFELMGLARSLHKASYDRFVITFDSPRLRLLARASGAKEVVLCRFDGRIEPIRPTLPRTAWDVVSRNVWGRVVYLGILLSVYGLRIKK